MIKSNSTIVDLVVFNGVVPLPATFSAGLSTALIDSFFHKTRSKEASSPSKSHDKSLWLKITVALASV